ncbi:MAG: hypothetical protein V1647_02975 [Pseudomonadota bacterium]
MKWWIIGVLLFAVIVVYSIPTINEAVIEKKVIKTARIVATDIINARLKAVQTKQAYGIIFIKTPTPAYKIFIDIDWDGIFDGEDKLVKEVFLSSIEKGVIYSKMFDDKGVVLKDDTFVFGVEKQNSGDSQFFIYDKDEQKQRAQNAIRVYIDPASENVKLLIVKELTKDGDLVFDEL